MLEDEIRKMCKGLIQRGKVDLYVTVEGDEWLTRKLAVDKQLLQQYIEAAEQIATALNVSPAVDLNALLQNEHIVSMSEQEAEHVSASESVILETIQASLHDLIRMREEEGQAIQAEFEQILVELKERIEQIERQAPSVIDQYQKRLKQRIRAIMSEEMDIDEQRLLTEVALFADKIDISEELNRLQSHIEQFETICAGGGAIGRKLDFLVQEMNREANTIGAKGSQASIRHQVVEMKSLIEKVKEQVQNIE